jgi:hypothetical protein
MNTEPADRLSKECARVRAPARWSQCFLSRFWAQRLLARSSWDTSGSLIKP